MDNRFNLLMDKRRMLKIVNATIIALLVVFELITAIQYDIIHSPSSNLIRFFVSAGLLLLSCIFKTYVIKKAAIKNALFILDFASLFVMCTATGGSYLVAFYSVILTQYYISVENIPNKFIVFIVSIAAFLLTFIITWMINNRTTEITAILIATLTGSVLGVIILSIHFVVATFIITYYNNNIRLAKALLEADRSKQRLKAAYEKLAETAIFEERNRIARDIHDNAGHSMTAVIMQTEAAKLLVDSNPEEAKQRIISANIQAKDALEKMRESVHLLAGRSAGITIKEELLSVFAQTMDGTGLKIRSNIDDASLTAEQHRLVSNAVKECIANGIRHGGATAFYVELKVLEDGVKLMVSDNGKGLDKNFKEGFGMKGMRSNVSAIGGEFEYESEPGEGVEVRITLKNGGEKK